MGSLPSDRPSWTGTEDPEHERIEFMLRTLDHVFDEHKLQINSRFDEAKKSQEMVLLRLERLFDVVQSGQAPLTTRVALVEEKIGKLSSVVYWVAATSVTSAVSVAAALFVAFATRQL